MITTILSYKFTELTRDEVEAMIGIELQETGFYKSAKAEGEVKIIVKLLQQRFGILPEELSDRIASLTIEQLELLTEEILDFAKINDLMNWLSVHG
jgi:predicted transposase YdaD